MKHLKITTQWLILLALTAVLTLMLRAIHLPGALLIGPMAAGIIVALNGARLNIHVRVYQCAQSLIGCMIAATLTPAIFHVFLNDWFLFIAVVLASLIASTVIGILLCKFHVMPNTTGIWGTTPGAASAMVVMAGIYGADVRLVAFMQYLRVLCVAITAAIVAHFFAETPTATVIGSHADVHWLGLAQTLGLAAAGLGIAVLLRIPAGVMLLPLVAGCALNVSGIITIEFPLVCQIITFAIIGWVIGLRFTKRIFLYAMRVMPKILVSIAALMGFCAVLGVVVAHVMHVDYLTAFLATSPGGADAMVIIAASANINLGFVMGLQIARLIIVMTLGPPVAKWAANRMK
jgi:membrane AbrB-like protein